MPTDPYFDRKHSQGRPENKQQSSYSGTASGKKSGAAASHTHTSSHKHAAPYREERVPQKSEKNAQSYKNAYAAERDPRRTREPEGRKTAEYSNLKPVKDSYETRYAQPKKKKKKFKFKRFFKKLGAFIKIGFYSFF